MRTVLITGGSRGLGAGLVKAFLDAGDRVATCGRASSAVVDAWQADETLHERFLFVEADLSEPPGARNFVSRAVDRFGAPDVLVNNAGVARDGVLALFDEQSVDTVVDLNVKGTIYVTKLVVRRMLTTERPGRIINISSIVGLSGYRGLSVYGATKAALDGFTRGLARELGPRNITVNSIAPGYLRTEMSHGLDANQLEQIARRTPAGRLGEVDDVVGAVRFLASPEASFVSGQVLVVDGGLTC